MARITDDEDNVFMIHDEDIFIKAPEYLITLAQSRSPTREYGILQRDNSDIIPFLLKNDLIPYTLIQRKL